MYVCVYVFQRMAYAYAYYILHTFEGRLAS